MTKLSTSEPRISLGKDRIVTMRELSQATGKVMGEILEENRPAMVTKHGRFLAVIVPVAGDKIESFVLAHLDEFVGLHDFDDQETEVRSVSTEEAAKDLGFSPDKLAGRSETDDT